MTIILPKYKDFFNFKFSMPPLNFDFEKNDNVLTRNCPMKNFSNFLLLYKFYEQFWLFYFIHRIYVINVAHFL